MWGRAEIVGAGYRGQVKEQIDRIEPGQEQILSPFYGVVGDGTWETVQGWWRLLFAGGPLETETQAPEATRRSVELTLSPQPLVVKGENAKANLSLASAGTHKLDGTIEIQCQRGLHTDIKAIEVKQLSVDKPLIRRVEVVRAYSKTMI